MVRGRRPKTPAPAESPNGNRVERDVDFDTGKDPERGAESSPPLTRSRKNARLRKMSRESPPMNGHITDYFRVVGSTDGKATPILRDESSWDRDDDCEKCDRPPDDPPASLDDERVDEKKFIINNIFKRENSTFARALYERSEPDRSEEGEFEENRDFKDFKTDEDEAAEFQNHVDPSNVRLSPRKHASTLRRYAVVNENNRTPHRINLCEKKASSRAVRGSSRGALGTKKLPNAKAGIKRLKNGDAEEEEEASSERTDRDEIVPKISKSVKADGVAESQNHKLTEYFPVRRSVRKTKKEVMEEKMRDLELAIKERREDGLEVASFEGKGRGVIASRTFHRGDFVVEYAGELVDLGEARVREAKYAQDHNAGCYMYYFRHNNQNYCIDATAESGRLGRLVNHSRNGNLITKPVFFNLKPHLVLIANQDIYPGEEVTYDYGDRSKESLQHHPWLAL